MASSMPPVRGLSDDRDIGFDASDGNGFGGNGFY